MKPAGTCAPFQWGGARQDRRAGGSRSSAGQRRQPGGGGAAGGVQETPCMLQLATSLDGALSALLHELVHANHSACLWGLSTSKPFLSLRRSPAWNARPPLTTPSCRCPPQPGSCPSWGYALASVPGRVPQPRALPPSSAATTRRGGWRQQCCAPCLRAPPVSSRKGGSWAPF